MKFARYLKDVENDAPTQWRGKFLNYKQLKKAIKKKHASDAAAALAAKHVLSFDDWFFQLLAADLKLINREFEASARQVIKYFDKGQSGLLRPLLACLPLPSAQLAANPEELAEQAHWCREYAQVNATGLRKIVKKHDKVSGNNAGQKFLQACWTSGNRGRATFLHSPLLTELKALEVMLEPQLAPKPALQALPPAAQPQGEKTAPAAAEQPGDLIAAGSGSGDAAMGSSEFMEVAPAPAPPAAPAAAAKPAPSVAQLMGALPRLLPGCFKAAVKGEDEPDADLDADLARVSSASEADDMFKCSICLEVMYKPLGLSCGHVFCTPCALGAAGMRLALGTTHAILQHTRYESACPECRKVNVYREAMPLKRAAQLIQKRWPEEWSRRVGEEKARQAELRRKLAEQRAAAADSYWGGIPPF